MIAVNRDEFLRPTDSPVPDMVAGLKKLVALNKTLVEVQSYTITMQVNDKRTGVS